MTVLKRADIDLLITLVSEEIHRVGEAKERHGSGDPDYFYRLVDIRNKLLLTSWEGNEGNEARRLPQTG